MRLMFLGSLLFSMLVLNQLPGHDDHTGGRGGRLIARDIAEENYVSSTNANVSLPEL